MRPPAFQREPAPGSRRGAALLLSLFVLIVILAVVFQIKIGTSTDARVARNAVGLTKMDLAIESIVLDYADILITDADGGSTGSEGAAADPLGGAVAGAAGGAEGESGAGGEEGPVDSRRDEWAKRRRTEIGGVELTVFLRPENSKYNILAMLTENEDEAEKALDRVVRIIDLFREGTDEDVDSGDAEAMADAMLEYMRERDENDEPFPALLTFDEEQEDLVLPLTLREFATLEPFEEQHFRDYRDENGDIVHSLEAFLTVWSSVSTRSSYEAARDSGPGSGAGGEGAGDGQNDPGGASATGTQQAGGDGRSLAGTEAGSESSSAIEGGDPTAAGGAAGGDGHRVNVNFAPRAVLFGLMDSSDVPARFWDDLVEYRNTEDEEEAELSDDDEPVLDEFGEEVVPYQFFGSVDELAEVDGWTNLEPIVQAELMELLTVESDVFSILVQARQATGAGEEAVDWTDRDAIREQQESGSNLVRLVRSTVWRVQGGESYQVVPLERWEVMDYRPFEVLDDPDEDR